MCINSLNHFWHIWQISIITPRWEEESETIAQKQLFQIVELNWVRYFNDVLHLMKDNEGVDIMNAC